MDYRACKNMNVKIISLNNPEWDKFFKQLPLKFQDPFLSSNYFKLKLVDNSAYCFVVLESDNIFFYPFIKTNLNNMGYKLDKNYYDIQGIYGYNGAIINSFNNEFITKSRKLFTEYCQDENVIAEFVRFNPIYKNHLYFSDMNIVCVNKNIIVDLDDNDIWMNAYEHSTRKNIKKAIRNNLEVKVIESNMITDFEIQTFIDIYTSTMVRNNADEEYFYDNVYFQAVREKLPNNALFIFVYKDKKAIAVELILYNSYISYSFLGGTLKEYFEYRPNDYLKHIVINYLKNKKIKYFCIGGGVEKNDGIFKYKKSFSKHGVYDFYIGKLIYNQKIYELMVNQWREKIDIDTQKKYENYLLKYHYKLKGN